MGRPSTSDSVADKDLEDTPGSPAPSEISSASAVSSSISFRVAQPRSNGGSDIQSLQGFKDKTITATVEILRGGCLPGDTIPVKVSVRHNRPVKSMNGVIITLYRKGRIDPHPLLPIGPTIKGKAPVFEDYYPRSRTGLSGLSLSSKGSNHAFRMDLAQTFAPMIINPNTLEADIKTVVRVPDDVLPSITCVPGGMITFTYHIEVILDLNGKLMGQDRVLPRMNMTGSPSAFGFAQGGNAPNHLVDTSEIRREKSIADCGFDIVVGTKDSQRKNVRRPLDPWEEAERALVPDPQEAQTERPPRTAVRRDTDISVETVASPLARQQTNGSHRPEPTRTVSIPPPEIEEPVDEKARLRRIEERLLPSAPPEEYASSSSFTPALAIPSAPTLGELNENYPPSDAPAYEGASAPSIDTIIPISSASTVRPNDPAVTGAMDDKHELERQRLLAAASSPDDRDDDGEEGVTAGPSFVPSAPVFNDDTLPSNGSHDDGHDTFAEATPLSTSSRHPWASENLPEYQK